MASIFSCKLFKAHKNRDKVVAALTNPVNVELTEQVASLIDDKDLQVLIDKSKQMQSQSNNKSDKSKESEDKSTSKESDISKEGTPHISMKKPSPSTFIPKGFEDSNSEEAEEVSLTDDTEIDVDDSNTESVPTEDIENTEDSPADTNSASKSGSTAPVTAGASVQDPFKDISTIPSQIKSLLNMSADTAGVTRVSIRDNELWIYYNDKTNLNNAMPLAIDALMAASYYYLEFNRLARTDNAMVFQIEFYSTNEVNTVKDAE